MEAPPEGHALLTPNRRPSAQRNRQSARTEQALPLKPLGDVGQPSDVGALARFLIGPESRWITGTAINIDGGHHLRRGPDFGPFIAPMLGEEVMQGGRRKEG